MGAAGTISTGYRPVGKADCWRQQLHYFKLQQLDTPGEWQSRTAIGIANHTGHKWWTVACFEMHRRGSLTSPKLQHSWSCPLDGYACTLCYARGIYLTAQMLMQIVAYAGGANDFVLPEPEPEDDWVNANMEFLAEVLVMLPKY